MPAGRIHDRITLWSLPLVAAGCWWQTGNSAFTLAVAGGFLFSGLMFGPDLDTNSRQYQRWGWFRWIWRPYQKAMRHRSLLSHGPVIGTVGRVLYLSVWLGGGLTLGTPWWAIVQQISGQIPDWQAATVGYGRTIVQALGQSLGNQLGTWLALAVGLELGAMSHVVSDWAVSAYKQQQPKPSPTKPARQGAQLNRSSKSNPEPVSWLSHPDSVGNLGEFGAEGSPFERLQEDPGFGRSREPADPI